MFLFMFLMFFLIFLLFFFRCNRYCHASWTQPKNQKPYYTPEESSLMETPIPQYQRLDSSRILDCIQENDEYDSDDSGY